MTLIAGVPEGVAADAPIVQGRAIVFEEGGFDWIGVGLLAMTTLME